VRAQHQPIAADHRVTVQVDQPVRADAGVDRDQPPGDHLDDNQPALRGGDDVVVERIRVGRQAAQRERPYRRLAGGRPSWPRRELRQARKDPDPDESGRR
jgi:hypothetical protein